MKNLILSDEETAMVYLTIKVFQDEAKENAPGFIKVLKAIESKIEQQIQDNPILLSGLVKIIRSEPELAANPQAAKLIDVLNHLVSAYRIFDEFKGETEACGLCEGIGRFVSGSGLPCPRCGGSGKLNKKETYN